MENGRPPKRRKELRKRKRKNQVKVENLSWTYLFLLSTDESLGSVAIHLVQPPFFLSWQSNDSKDTGKRKGQGGLDGFFFFYSLRPMRHLLPLTTINSVVHYCYAILSLLLSLTSSGVCICVCQYLLLFFLSSPNRADVRKSEPKLCVTLAVSSYSLTSFSFVSFSCSFHPLLSSRLMSNEDGRIV